jgi:ParB family chromosome partitioning protein
MNKTGRGLKELLEDNYIDINDIKDGEVVLQIELSKIKPNPYQPRKVFDEEKIDELAASISENGVFQPIIVKQFDDKYIIVSGERRFRACQKLKLTTIPAIVRAYDESKVAEIALIENLQRENLTAMEEAIAYQTIMRELGLTQAELAKKIGKSRSYITNVVGLLSLPPEVANLVSEGKITSGHARPLSKLKDEKRIIEIANEIVSKNLNVRDVEEITKNEKKTKTIKVSSNKFVRTQNKLENYLGCKVKVSEDKIIINFPKEKRNEIVKKISGDK